MTKSLRVLKWEIFPISLILVLTFFRLFPHPPNFTPIIAVAILSSYFFKNIYLSIITLLASMLLSDALLGFHQNLFFVYFSLCTITFTFFTVSKKINYKNLFIYGFFGSLIFYLISNFGVWALQDLYEKNLNGLISCYFFAIPFFKNTLLSTIIFSYAALFVNNIYLKRIAQ